MKTIGLVGGRNWEATAAYYQLINLEVNKRLGEHHAARIAAYSIDYKMVEGKVSMPEMNEFADMTVDACKRVVQSGADVIVLTTNTMHLVQEQISEKLDVPIIHIADAVGGLMQRRRYDKVGVLGSGITAGLDFYSKRLMMKYGLEAVLPTDKEQIQINNLILDELPVGELELGSHQLLVEIIERFYDQKLDGVVFACPELTNLLRVGHVRIPVVDATKVHSEAVVAWALGIVE